MYGQADVTRTFSGKVVSPTNRLVASYLKLLRCLKAELIVGLLFLLLLNGYSGSEYSVCEWCEIFPQNIGIMVEFVPINVLNESLWENYVC